MVLRPESVMIPIIALAVAYLLWWDNSCGVVELALNELAQNHYQRVSRSNQVVLVMANVSDYITSSSCEGSCDLT